MLQLTNAIKGELHLLANTFARRHHNKMIAHFFPSTSVLEASSFFINPSINSWTLTG